MQINLYGVEMDLYGLISVIAVIIFVAIIAIPLKLKWDRDEKARKADYDKEHEIKGMVDEVRVTDYAPGGFGSSDRPEQTLIFFKDGSQITIKGLHLDIRKGQTWKIRYRGTDKWYRIKPLIEKKIL